MHFLKHHQLNIKICISERPGRPGKPMAEKISEEAITLLWTAPDSPGSSPITSYVLEKRLVDKSTWTIAGKSASLCQHTVCFIEIDVSKNS